MADKGLFDGSFKIGDEVIVQGTRDMWGSKGEQSQIVISNATIYRNLFGGDGTYPTDSFISGKTLADLAAMPTDETAHTAEVYVLEDVTISAVIEEKFSRYDLVQGDTKMQLYCSSTAAAAPSTTAFSRTMPTRRSTWNLPSATGTASPPSRAASSR